jgi:hypothetical protein
MLDCSLCIHSILGLAGERVVRKELVTMLEKIVKANEKSQGG